jgi:MFS family permease
VTHRTAHDAAATTSPDEKPTEVPAPTDNPSQAEPRWLLPSVAVMTVGVTVFLSLHSRTDPDTWWNLRAGQYLLDTGKFVGPEPWVRFASRPFVLTEWLGDVLGATLYDWFGLPALAWMLGACILALVAGMVVAARRVADLVPAVIAVLAGLVIAAGSLSQRPQAVSFVFVMITVIAWWLTASDLRPRWWLVPLTWVWACLHGFWLFGPVIGAAMVMGLFLDRRLDRRSLLSLSGVVGASLLAAGLTPVGPRLLALPFQVHSAASGLVQEWQPSNTHSPITVLALVVIFGIVLIWLRRPEPPPWWQVGQLGLALVLSLAYARLLSVAACLLVPLLASALQSLHPQPASVAPRSERRLWASLFVAAALATAALTPVFAAEHHGVPIKLSPQISAIPTGSVVFDDYAMGSWLLWSARHVTPVIDGRIELYDEKYVERYVNTLQVGAGWSDFLTDTGATYALVADKSPISTALADRLHWQTLGRDAGFVLMKAP